MLEVKKVSKVYKTGEVEMKALDGVSVSFRRNEFVSILGPSGSGKTTLLNIIGGLDHYTSGDLIIDGISTKDYTDRDWDAYRNHRVGFVFQNYNLISHQTILSNVELALTLSGVSGAEKRRRASEALKKVGLEKHLEKLPSQLSGGQMQRVSIARALVNEPDIVLADEPTGALDSKTSLAIMNILKDIAKDKLVVMVTHNPDLAKAYSTRIISVKDGKIVGDTKPFDESLETKSDTRPKHTSMSLLTALNLSKNNLMTKRGRTILTAVAGSIGIIGIALILALANGVNKYAANIAGTGSVSTAITVSESYSDSSASSTMMGKSTELSAEDGKIVTTDDVISNWNVSRQDSIRHNDTKSFKSYIEAHRSELDNYVDNISYDYGVSPTVFDKTKSGTIITVYPTGENNILAALFSSSEALGAEISEDKFLTSNFSELTSTTPYELLSGSFPTSATELLLVTSEDSKIPLSFAYALNLADREVLSDFVYKVNHGGDLTSTNVSLDYSDIIGKTYRLAPSADEYENGETLTIVGIAKPKSKGDASEFVGYSPKLSEKLVKATGGDFDTPSAISFVGKSDSDKENIKTFLDNYNNQAPESAKITYSDETQEMVNSIKKIVNMLSYVLIAFVAISLVVSSIMIGIITYISVLERTKEIGILRAIGASKRDVVRVFRAETIIEGLVAGVLGVVTSWVLCQLISAIVSFVGKIDHIASLSLLHALILIAISVVLTVFAGASPARRASKKDPVEALRSE